VTLEKDRATYDRVVDDIGGPVEAEAGDIGFRDQVALWLEVWTVGRPELAEQARAVADPAQDPWGYLAALGELVLTTD